jgi:hypothetical protein
MNRDVFPLEERLQPVGAFGRATVHHKRPTAEVADEAADPLEPAAAEHDPARRRELKGRPAHCARRSLMAHL